jgi:hypothetical protein
VSPLGSCPRGSLALVWLFTALPVEWEVPGWRDFAHPGLQGCAIDLRQSGPRKRFELPLVQTGLKLRIWERERRPCRRTMPRSETSRRALRRFLVGAAIGLTMVILFGAALV